MIYNIKMIYWLIKGNYYGSLYEDQRAKGYQALGDVAQSYFIEYAAASRVPALWVLVLIIMMTIVPPYFVAKEIVKYIIKQI